MPEHHGNSDMEHAERTGEWCTVSRPVPLWVGYSQAVDVQTSSAGLFQSSFLPCSLPANESRAVTRNSLQ